MTPDELNAEIAELKGWKPPGHPETEAYRQLHGFTHSSYDASWYHATLRAFVDRPPDYAGDWQHCGPLLEEMLEAGVVITRMESRSIIGVRHRVVTDGREHEGDTLTESIAAAWLAWKKGEQDAPNPERTARIERLREYIACLRTTAHATIAHAEELTRQPVDLPHGYLAKKRNGAHQLEQRADDIEALLKEVADGENRG